MGIIGIANPLTKGVFRNMGCPCGSGKKTKKCHGQKFVITDAEYQEIINLENKRNEEFAEALMDVANAAKSVGKKDGIHNSEQTKEESKDA